TPLRGPRAWPLDSRLRGNERSKIVIQSQRNLLHDRYGACAGGRSRCGISTQAEAAKISAKPIISDVVRRSPSRIIEPSTPTTGVASEPSDAMAVESRLMMLNQRK